ncbi:MULTISPECIES: hypothetical protein [unclassified Microbacterium]|uniref:hypothetical protein n=1 Tax=unclassified Microbacterium TaxID=2609290 RepID=UPI00288355B9|nr:MULTISPECIES: hypothetical protein [unclassified Microbacterium]
MTVLSLVLTLGGIAIVGTVVLGVIVMAIIMLSRRGPSRAQRAQNQQNVEEWIARTKGEDHVRRMRGE